MNILTRSLANRISVVGSFVIGICVISVFAGRDAAARTVPAGERTVIDTERQTAEVLFTSYQSNPALDFEQAGIEFIESRPALFHLEHPASELALLRERTDKVGRTHLRYQQEYRGLPVWGCQKIVHFAPDRSIYMVAGQTIATPTISTLPGIGEREAVEVSRRELGSLNPPLDAKTEAELMIYPDGERAVLTWRVTTKWTDVSAYRWRMFVDANTSEVLLSYNDVCDQGPEIGTGIDVEDIWRPLNTYSYLQDLDFWYQLEDASRAMYVYPDLSVIATYDDIDNGGGVFIDPNGDNIWDDTPWLKAAVSGHYNAGLTYEYFLNTFGWNSYDNQGSSIIVTVLGFVWYNAQWSGEYMRFGRGNGSTFLDMSGGLDILAHEFTHGVTEYTAGLAYLYQPGALNEAYSDFFGAMVDRDEWLMGDQTCLEYPYFFRCVSDPHEGLWGPLPAHMNEYVDLTIDEDWGGVHVNMGIPDKAGYLMAMASSREVAEQIWFHTLTNYLTPLSDFSYWADMVFQSAIDLYGFPSAEADAVSAALDSVGLGAVTALPASLGPLPVAMGSILDTTFRLRNLNSQTVDLLTGTCSQGLFDLTGSFPQGLAYGDSAVFALSYDATGAGSPCDLGLVYDTIVFSTSSASYPEIRVPVIASVGYSAVSAIDSTLATSCTELGVRNTPAMTGLTQAGTELMAYGSLMIGMLDGADTTVYGYVDPKSGYYVDRWYGKSFAAVDGFESGVDVKGRQTRTAQLITEDGRVQGTVRYRFDESEPAACEYYLVDYTLTNPCDTPLAMLVGVFSDPDLPPFSANTTSYDSQRDMVYMRSPTTGKAIAWAPLIGSARNLRAVNYGSVLLNGLTPGEAYEQLVSIYNSNGTSQDDWTILLTLGEVTIAAGESVGYTVILLQSDNASLQDDLDAIRGNMCGVEVAGDANDDGIVSSSDIIYMVNHVFKSGPEPLPCPATGDATADGVLTSADVIWLVNYTFKSGIPPLDVCALVPDTWPCY